MRWHLLVLLFLSSGLLFQSQNPKVYNSHHNRFRVVYNQIADMMIQVADLRLDTKTREVRRAKRQIHLTKQELKLLQLLMENKNEPVSRKQILSRIWHASGTMKTRIVDVYVGYLRKKIDHGFKKKLINTVHAKGYMITS